MGGNGRIRRRWLAGGGAAHPVNFPSHFRRCINENTADSSSGILQKKTLEEGSWMAEQQTTKSAGGANEMGLSNNKIWFLQPFRNSTSFSQFLIWLNRWSKII